MSMELLEREIRFNPLALARAVLRHMGPEFWIVAVYPFYISWVWASGEIYPSYHWLAANPAGPGTYLAHVTGWLANSWRFVLGAVVVGPLLGGATVLYDDYFDLEVDRANPRKSALPFHKRPTRPGVILGSALALFAVSMAMAALVGLAFLAASAAIAGLSFVYTTPPVRTKARAGLDVATNMLGFGVLCSLAGWVIERPVGGYPWLWLLPMVLGTGALYIPTTVADAPADGRMGVGTVAVRLGDRRAVYLAIALLALANAAIIGLGLSGYLYSPGAIAVLWPLSVLEVVPLAYLVWRRSVGSILWAVFVTSSLMAMGTLMLLLDHVGLWHP